MLWTGGGLRWGILPPPGKFYILGDAFCHSGPILDEFYAHLKVTNSMWVSWDKLQKHRPTKQANDLGSQEASSYR